MDLRATARRAAGEGDLAPPASPATPVTFSVVVPTHNRARFVRRAIDSVLVQSYADLELLVVDDASADSTTEVLSQFDDPRLRITRHPVNRGVSAARNSGHRLAQGRYIVYLDDDDYLMPECLAAVDTALAEALPTVGAVILGRRTVRLGPAGEELLAESTFGYATSTVCTGREYLQRPFAGASGLVVTSACRNSVGDFDLDPLIVDDTDFLIRIARRFDILVLAKPLITVVNHGESQLSKPSFARAIRHEHLADHYVDVLGSEARRYRYNLAARIYFSLGQRADGRRAILKAVRLRPGRVRTWAAWLLLESAASLPIAVRRRIYGSERQRI